ncbi:MAG: M23 family metallopeptidase [Proteobacteria bacterium]|nr:M23 family metallopeptidase [Pseudomonadota bacterium]MCP4919341.1 M23 family metallopeptidase [Pseudomonadota bacterium]
MRNDKYRPNSPPYLLYGLLGVSLGMNIILAVKLGSDDAPSADVAAVEVESIEVAAVEPAPVDEVALAAAETVEPIAPSVTAVPEGYHLVHGTIDHSLARTFKAELDEDADAIAAVYSRLFMWDLDLRRDVQKGDEVWAIYKVNGAGDVEIPAAWYESGKLGRTLKAYEYRADGDTFASYWFDDGTEVPYRLVAGPLQDYEQITSLLRDRPTHEGMDFKTPVGTPVVTPKSGTVTRVNWNHAANGNCVEVRYADGTLAKFLHLDKLAVQAGQHVTSSQVLADSGNTGTSTAPHLHYQLDRSGKTVDPLDYHDTLRRRLDDDDGERFAQTRVRYDAMLGEEVAAR